jgi:hypothetical protein
VGTEVSGGVEAVYVVAANVVEEVRLGIGEHVSQLPVPVVIVSKWSVCDGFTPGLPTLTVFLWGKIW